MAATVITKVELKRSEAKEMPTGATAAKTEGATVAFDKADEKILLMLKNAVANVTHTAVIRAGNGLQGVSDLEIPIDGGKEVAVVVESGRYMNVSGDNKGKVVVASKDTTTGTQIEVRAIALP